MTKQTTTHFLKGGITHTAITAALLTAMTGSAWAQINNTAEVSGSSPRGTVVTDSSTETITLQTPTPTFTIAKSIASVSAGAGNDAANPDDGDIITYEYLVANTGNVSLDGTTLLINDPSPTFNGAAPTNSITGLTLISGDANTNGNIDIGETFLYRATYTLDQIDVDNAAGISDGVTSTISAASIDSTGTFGAATFDTANSTLTASTTIAENGSLQLVKLATRDGTNEDDGSVTPYNTGDTVIYRMTVTNNGNVTMASMTVSDTAFDGVGTISAVNCTTSGDATIATLAPGASEVCSATYVIQQGDLQ